MWPDGAFEFIVRGVVRDDVKDKEYDNTFQPHPRLLIHLRKYTPMA